MLDSTNSEISIKKATTTIMDVLLSSPNIPTATESAIEVPCKNVLSSSTSINGKSIKAVESIENRKTPNTTPTHKSLKTNIFSWLRSATTTTNTHTEATNLPTTKATNQNRNENRFSAPPLWMRPRNTSPDVTSFREFRGVQSLRHLWNKRISANAEAVRQNNNNNNKGKLTKSISCLVSTTSGNEGNKNTIFPPNGKGTVESFCDFQKIRPNRAQSLHDCRPFGVDAENGNALNSDLTISDNTNTVDREIDPLHREKDNFYKYKTAEQASVHIAREARARARARTKSIATAGDVRGACCHINGNTHFPAITKSESGAGHIHWLKRNDINIAKRSQSELEKCNSTSDCNDFQLQGPDTIMAVRDKESSRATAKTIKSSTITLSESSDVISSCDSSPANTTSELSTEAETVTMECEQNANNKNRKAIEAKEVSPDDSMGSRVYNRSTNSFSPASSDTDTLTAANTPQHSVSSAALIEQKGSGSQSSVRATQNSENTDNKGSASSSPASSGSRKRTLRKTGSSSSNSTGSARKYSFKTHSKNYIVPRKMHGSRDGGTMTNGNNGIGITAGVGCNGSVVAKLTQQFNEIIQKDKALLKEVKRKNGVLCTRGGHVYKVIDTNDPHQLKKSNSMTSPSISRTSSRGSKDLTTSLTTVKPSPHLSVVKKTIKKFEVASEKPIVPVKNLQVLQKKDIGRLKKSEEKQEPKENSDETNAVELRDKKGSVRRNNLVLPLATLQQQMLEVVKEEARTPLDTENKRLDPLVDSVIGSSPEKQPSTDPTVNKSSSVADISDNDELSRALDEQKLLDKPNVMGPSHAKSNGPNPESPQPVSMAAAENVVINSPSMETLPKPDNDSIVNLVTPATTLYDTMVMKPNDKKQNNNKSEVHSDSSNTSTRQRYRKKCAKIYEKFRFFSPFDNTTNNSKTPLMSVPITTTSPKDSHKIFTPPDNDDIHSSKLLTALKECDEKLKSIENSITKPMTITEQKDASQLNEKSSPESKRSSTNNVVFQDDDFEQRVLPNNSFIHHSCAKQLSNNQLLLSQAVNVTLVNSIEGEQMIMEQKELQTKILTPDEDKDSIKPTVISQIIAKSDETIYESINTNEPELQKTENDSTPTSFLYKSCQKKNFTNVSQQDKATIDPSDDMYQTLEEARHHPPTLSKSVSISSLNDYESIAGSCEQSTSGLLISTTTTTTTTTVVSAKSPDDGYEVCEPPPEEPVITQLSSSSSATTITMVRNTNDELPELPKPKRRLPKSPIPTKRPPKVASSITVKESDSPVLIAQHVQDIEDHHYYADDENIYDTIKGSHCYESLQASNSRLRKTASTASSVGKSAFENGTTADSVSLSSNCYESITHYRRVILSSSVGHATGSSSGSTLTISSDHKTNSLYEAPLSAVLLFPGTNDELRNRKDSSSADSAEDHVEIRIKKRNSQGTPCTLPGSQKNIDGENVTERTTEKGLQPTIPSDNSDEWIDISESEADGVEKQQFIVVRERQKIHRSPDWSKRVRDKRLQNTNTESCIEDDSDHYYETLSPLGGKRQTTQSTMQTQLHKSPVGTTNVNDISAYKSESMGQQYTKKHYYGSSHGLVGNSTVSDDYDSFDSSVDETFDGVQNGLRKDVSKYNDSGVDIRNVKLPEPPPTTNQVYAIVKKLKKFISNKKSPSTGTAKSNNSSGSQQKLYENSSQFYVEENIYRTTPKSKSLPKLIIKKSPAIPPPSQEDYENSEFHTTKGVFLNSDNSGGNTTTPKSLSNSERNLSGTHVYQTNPKQNTEIIQRSKAKSGRSLRSRLHRSLAGSTSEAKSQSTLSSKRSTFYIEEPSIVGLGEHDSDFSEKVSSGDLPVPTPESQKFSTVARKAKKEAKSSQRRRTVIGLRPHDPPPPPPDDAALERMKNSKSTTSWYAECGVFKNGGTIPIESLDETSVHNTSKNTIYNQSCSLTTTSSSWYAEAGLYQTSGISVASSSGSSGVSTGNETSLGDELAHSFFMNEPLYQIYNAEKLESISRDIEDNDSSTDGYEEIGQNSNISSKRNEERQSRPRPSALQLVGPKAGPARTLWSEIPEVINSCVLLTLTPRERALQEAKFEILTSEASYLKSLNLLRSHFMNHPVFRDTNIVSARDRKALFSYIVPVHECSERLLTEMESCWQDNIMLLGLSKRIYGIAEKHFRVYIDFCEHQGRMDRTLRRLKEAKGTFVQNLDLLEASPTCCGLNLHSFLMLPMQRITRLPLLIDAVFSKVNPNDDEYDNWKMTLAILNKIVAECNEAANRCEQAYEIERISRQLEFPSTIRALAIAPVGVPAPGSKPRFLVKKGELTHLIWRGDEAKLTFGRKITKSTIFAFLFSDLLVLTKRKSEEQFTVFDYCPRNMLTISSGNALPQLPTKDLNQTGKNLILMTLLENCEQKTVELVLSCSSVSEQERWLQTMRQPESETPGEKLYEQWDCPQVIATHAYKANEPDALNFDIGDVVNVMRKLPDGWYQGERIRDGATGWFPGNFTEEVNSAHVRARNLKQRHRLLTFTATYLESRKQK